MARYRKVDPKLWGDAKFRALSGEAKLLWLYLLTCPESNHLPGLLVLGRAHLAEMLSWTVENLTERFNELLEKGLVKADFDARVIWLPNAMRYNRPDNPNCIGPWGLLLENVPECDLKTEAIRALRDGVAQLGPRYLERFPKQYREPFDQGMPNLELELEPDLNHRRLNGSTSGARAREAFWPPQHHFGASDHSPSASNQPVPVQSVQKKTKHDPWLASAWKLWRSAYRTIYRRQYTDSSSCGKAMIAIVVLAKRHLASADGSTATPKNYEHLLQHWFRSFLNDNGDRGFLKRNGHMLRFMDRSIPYYGTPWDTGARRPAWAVETNGDQSAKPVKQRADDNEPHEATTTSGTPEAWPPPSVDYSPIAMAKVAEQSFDRNEMMSTDGRPSPRTLLELAYGFEQLLHERASSSGEGQKRCPSLQEFARSGLVRTRLVQMASG